MLVAGIDPAATTGAGYAEFDGARLSAFLTPPDWRYDAAAVEGPWPGKMGKVQMWSLGFTAARAILAVKAERKFILTPKVWRAQWPCLVGGGPWDQLPQPARAVLPLPKDVIVGRLRRDIVRLGFASGEAVSAWTDDMVEAGGIAVALWRLLTTPGPKGKPWRPKPGQVVRA